MNKKSILSTLALSAAAVILLSGCTQTNKNNDVITFADKAPVLVAPSWSSSSVSFLMGEGWAVQTVDVKNSETPKTFYATNKDNTCNITYSSTVDGTENKNTDEEYLSREKAYIYTDSLNSSETDDAFANIKIASSKDKLQMLQVSYTAPNITYITDTTNSIDPATVQGQPNGENPAPEYSTNGVINGMSLSRVFDTIVDNPFANQSFKATASNEAEAKNNVPTKEGRPNIIITYQCVNTAISDKFWASVVSHATIDFGQKS